MTTTADDETVGRAFEAVLAGRPVPPSAQGLAAFADGVRSVAERPGRPSAALAELLATGLIADQPTTAGRAAPAAAGRAGRRRTRMFVPALLAKIASLSAVAKAAAVTGVVVAGFTTAGVTGALPTPVQHGFTDVVSTITPFGTVEPADTTVTPSEETGAPTPGDPSATPTATESPESSEPAGRSDADEPSGSADPGGAAAPGGSTEVEDPGDGSSHPDNFGATVSRMAHEADGTPGVDGAAVSSLAHERNEDRRSGTTAAAPARTAAPTAAPAPTEGEQATEDSSGHSRGSGKGRGSH